MIIFAGEKQREMAVVTSNLWDEALQLDNSVKENDISMEEIVEEINKVRQ